jgi:hypothetical protein
MGINVNGLNSASKTQIMKGDTKMKKLLTLVLALVLVFAIAAPAMAITTDTIDPALKKPVDFVTLDIALFENSVVSNIGFNLSQVAANKVYVADQLAYWGVAIHFDKPGLKEVRNMVTTDYEDCYLDISSDAIAFQSGFKAFYSEDLGDYMALPATLNELTLAKNVISSDAFGSNWFVAHDYDIRVFGSGVVKKQGVVMAELYVDQSTLPITVNDGTTPLYTVNKTTYGYDVVKDAHNRVEFVVVASGTRAGKVDHINVVWNDATYTIAYNVTYGSSLTPTVAAKALLQGTNVYDIAVTTEGAAGYLKDSAKMFAFYEKVMAFFGFNPALDGYLRDVHFLAKASGLYLKDEVPVQLYTGSIVVPGDVVPPKTGDAASIVGFVMIAVAMIAAGVVVSRKVRA